MKKCHEKLEDLIKEVVIPDIEDAIDDIFETIANNKNASDKTKAQSEQMHEMKDEFTQMLDDLDNNDIDIDECNELYKEIEDMIKD